MLGRSSPNFWFMNQVRQRVAATMPERATLTRMSVSDRKQSSRNKGDEQYNKDGQKRFVVGESVIGGEDVV